MTIEHMKKKVFRIPASDGIEKLMTGGCSQSWVPKAVHFVTESDIAPGFDIVAFLEDPNGAINELRVVFGVAVKPDAPRVVQQRGAPCRLSIFWNEVEVVNRILLSFKSRSSLSSLFLQLVSAFSHIGDTVVGVLPN